MMIIKRIEFDFLLSPFSVSLFYSIPLRDFFFLLSSAIAVRRLIDISFSPTESRDARSRLYEIKQARRDMTNVFETILFILDRYVESELYLVSR